MINAILVVCLLYLVQLILPGFFSKEETAAVGKRALNALHNLRESLPVFFVLAVISQYNDVESNILLAQAWILFRSAFLLVYAWGLNLKPVDEFGRQAQPLRSLIWVGSVVCLVWMAINIAMV